MVKYDTYTITLHFKSHCNLSWNKKYRHENMSERQSRKQSEEEIKAKRIIPYRCITLLFSLRRSLDLRDIGTAQSNNRTLYL